MTVHEPATLATDYLLAAVAAALARRLHRRISPENRAARWWVWTLGLTGASALIGGSYHGFAPNFSATINLLWWRITLWTVCLIGAAMAAAWVCETVRPPWQQRMMWGVAGKFFAFATLAAVNPTFSIAILDYGISMVLWLGAALALGRRWSGWMLMAIGLYHVLQAFALAAFYRAALRLESSLA